MLRLPPSIDPPNLPPDLSPQPPAYEKFSLSLRLITPMFGGSATARQTDAQNPIRAASIRGQLRFWWRATTGARFSDAAALFQAEEALWGSAEKAGTVALNVEVTEKGHLKSLDKIASKGNAQTGPRHRYFLFPFEKEKKAGELLEAQGREEVAFRLEVRFPQLQRDEVRSALRAWLFFGGIGARTRRGCGALTVGAEQKEWLPQPRFDASWFGIAGEERNRHLANLQGANAFVGNATTAMECWRGLGTFWTRFRKGHFVLSDKPLGPMDGGRWNDHEKLRAGRARAEIELAKPFLGLPLIYQGFPPKGRHPASFAGTLEAVAPHGTRFASPVILKPAAFADGKIRPLILVLSGPQPETIRIESRNGNFEATLKTPENDAMLEHFQVNHPLDAVCEAALADGFGEVPL